MRAEARSTQGSTPGCTEKAASAEASAPLASTACASVSTTGAAWGWASRAEGWLPTPAPTAASAIAQSVIPAKSGLPG